MRGRTDPNGVSMVTHPVRRGLVSAAVTVALMAVFLLVPAATQVYASNMMGTLRSPGEPAFVAGHRGDRASAPENTLPAFEAALDGPLEFVETDVQLTADGVPVLLHDETVDRTTDGTGAVADLTLAQLQAARRRIVVRRRVRRHPHPDARRVPRPASRAPTRRRSSS